MGAFSWPEAIYELDRGHGLAVCVAHQGAHVYDGGCRALPPRRPPFSEPIARCQEDATCRLADGTHVHAPATKIEIDVDGLAEAIVRASRAAREERQSAQSPPPATPAGPAGSTSIVESYRE